MVSSKTTEATIDLECCLLRIRAIGALFCLARVGKDTGVDLTSTWWAMGSLLVASADEALEILDATVSGPESGMA